MPAVEYVAKEQGISDAEAKPYVDDVQRRFDVHLKEASTAENTSSPAGGIIVIIAVFTVLFVLFKSCN